jgi:LysM repeat protein
LEILTICFGFFLRKNPEAKEHRITRPQQDRRHSVPMTMNNQSPLIPQGSLLEQKNKGRARVKIAVFLVLAIHGIGLMALLMQGCKKEPDTNTMAAANPPTSIEATNTAAPAFAEPTNSPALATNAYVLPTNTITTPTPVEPQPTPPATTAATDYVIVKGDTFSTISKKFHVATKALLEANPSVEPTKLKIGQTVHIPAAVNTAMASTGTAPAVTSDTGSTGQTYAVRSGDSLTKIAGEFGISVKSLRSFNNLKTDKIVVGQKLKIPAKTSTQQAATTALPPGVGAGQ